MKIFTEGIVPKKERRAVFVGVGVPRRGFLCLLCMLVPVKEQSNHYSYRISRDLEIFENALVGPILIKGAQA